MSVLAWSGVLFTFWDAFNVLASMGGFWSTHVAMQFVSSLMWHRQSPLPPALVNTSWGTFLCPRCHGMGLFRTSWDTYIVLAGNTGWDTFIVLISMGGLWSIHVEINFVSSMIEEGFGQRTLRYIFCPCWHGRGLVNTCWVLGFMDRFGQFK